MQKQQAMMAEYAKYGVSPLSGCLPMLLQIPIFFSLYKVIFVTIELRHAPWLGWIRDLSAPDPSSLWNFFGLMPWATPGQGSFLHSFTLPALAPKGVARVTLPVAVNADSLATWFAPAIADFAAAARWTRRDRPRLARRRR